MLSFPNLYITISLGQVGCHEGPGDEAVGQGSLLDRVRDTAQGCWSLEVLDARVELCSSPQPRCYRFHPPSLAYLRVGFYRQRFSLLDVHAQEVFIEKH